MTSARLFNSSTLRPITSTLPFGSLRAMARTVISLRAFLVDPDRCHALNRGVDLEAMGQVCQIARDPMSIRAKQARKLDAARILAQSVIDGVQLSIGSVPGNRETSPR